MVEQAVKSKTPLVNVSITQNAKESDADKENDGHDEGDGGKKKGSKVHIYAHFGIITADLVYGFLGEETRCNI
jgi:hypothetical protein